MSSAADQRLEAALKDRGLQDPRPYCRTTLRSLRESEPERYEEEVAYFSGTLLASLESESGEDPCTLWTDYALRLSEAATPGAAVAIDPTGSSSPLVADAGDDCVLLHLPSDPRARASVLRAPMDPAAPQRATIGLLTEGWRGLPSESS
jgi:hypothetical protein